MLTITQKMCNIYFKEAKMQFSEWIEKSGKTMKQVADDLGVNYEDVRRYCAGEVIPRPDRVQKIYEYTGGKVEPNDWYITR